MAVISEVRLRRMKRKTRHRRLLHEAVKPDEVGLYMKLCLRHDNVIFPYGKIKFQLAQSDTQSKVLLNFSSPAGAGGIIRGTVRVAEQNNAPKEFKILIKLL